MAYTPVVDISVIGLGDCESDAPLAAHVLAVHLAGNCRLERPARGHWRTYRPTEGDISITSMHADPRFRVSGRAQVLRLLISEDRLAECGVSFDVQPITARRVPLLTHLAFEIREQHISAEHDVAYLQALERTLVLHLLRMQCDVRSRCGGLPAWRLKRAIDYLHSHATEALDLAALATHVGLSPAYCSSQFRAATGRSPQQYLLAIRLERARSLLSTTRSTVQAVARQTGFASASHLGAFFKRSFGETPGSARARAHLEDGAAKHGATRAFEQVSARVQRTR